MTVLGALFERRSIENPAVPLTAATLAEYFDGGAHNESGMSVSEKTVLGIPAVWRAVNVVSGLGASLPLKTYKNNTRTRIVSRLLSDPYPEMTFFEWSEFGYVSVCLWGNAYYHKRRNAAGIITELQPIPPSAVKVGRVKRDEYTPGGKVFEVTAENGQRIPWTTYEVLHIPGFGYDGTCGVSPIRAGRQSFGLTMAAETYGARLFGSGSLLSGILQTDQRIDDVQAEELKQRWRSTNAGIRKAHDITVLGSGASFQPITMPNDDAQFLQSREFQVREIARWFGLPPHMLFDVTGSTSWGTGIEQQSIGFVKFNFQPQWLSRFEQRFTKEATPPGTYAEYTVEGLLRGDSAARAQFYQVMRQIEAMSANEVRDRENLEPIEGGDTYENPAINPKPEVSNV